MRPWGQVRYVALKVIKEASLASESARERFLREAQLAGRLRHPNVAVVHDFGSYFYVSELIDGHTVDEHVRKNGPFQPVEALEIALQVARALSAAARMNLIHRDLKPANIMLEVDDEGTDPIVEKNNKCSGNKLNGIMLWSGSKGTVRGNVCEGNQQSGAEA
jgi:parallel beta-helix repeat protein